MVFQKNNAYEKWKKRYYSFFFNTKQPLKQGTDKIGFPGQRTKPKIYKIMNKDSEGAICKEVFPYI